jgi:hypothetical protein
MGGLLLAHWGVTPRPANAASHLWRFNEIFTNADGTIQFIELKECCGAAGETALQGKWVRSDATGNQYTFPQNLTPPTSNRHLLLATASFAALPGAPTPDFIIPAHFFDLDDDFLRYWLYADAIMNFGPGQLPTDGLHSLNEDLTTGINSPTNYAGVQGSVDVRVCIDDDGDGYGSPGDPDCPAGAQEDCDDTNPDINPGEMENCIDMLDNNCNAAIDCNDPACSAGSACVPAVSRWGVLALVLFIVTAGTAVFKHQKAAV